MKEFIDLLGTVLEELAPPSYLLLLAYLRSGPMAQRRHAAEQLAAAGYEPSAHLMAALLPTAPPELAEALEASAAKLKPALLDAPLLADGLNSATVRWLLLEGLPWVAVRALMFLEARANRDVAELVHAAMDSDSQIVRVEAYRAAEQLTPERLGEVILARLRDPAARDVRSVALLMLRKKKLPFDRTALVAEGLRTIDGPGGAELFGWARREMAARLDEWLAAAAQSVCSATRLVAVQHLGEHGRREHLPLLEPLVKDDHPHVADGARAAIARIAPERAWAAAVQGLRHWSEQVRADALRALSNCRDPDLLDEILPLCRDASAEIRISANLWVSQFDDPRVLAELVSALNDVDPKVCDATRRLLEQSNPPIPVVQEAPRSPGEPPIWETLRERADAVNDWAEDIGVELLGRPIRVHNYRQGLGRTWLRGKRDAVEIEVSDTPVTMQHPHGEQIMRALALHELGHHVCDFGERSFRKIAGQVRSEKLRGLFNVVLDERLERQLRSRRPEWGALFDRLASYAFAQNEHRGPLARYAALLEQPPEEVLRRVQRGELPGRMLPPRTGETDPQVGLSDSDSLRIPGLLPPFLAFLMCLRCGFDPGQHPDPKVTQAVALVPGNLKNLPHGDVLKIVRRLGELLGRDPEQEQQFRLLLVRLRRHSAGMPGLARALRRLLECDQLPPWVRDGWKSRPSDKSEDDELAAWARREAVGIRHNPPRRRKRRSDSERVHTEARGGQLLNLGEGLDFPRLSHERVLQGDPQRHAELAARARPYARALRVHLERLGRRTREEYAMRRGRRIDLAVARRVALLPNPNLLVYAEEEFKPDAYIGLLIDRSGSMETGEKMELAKRFAVLLTEAARGIRGLSGDVNAFDDASLIRLGNFERNAIAALQPGGGNNDAGALQRAAELARASGKRRRLLIMVSDGSPTECTVASLKALVDRLTRRHDIRCAQVAVERLEHVTFPHHVDVTQHPLPEAVKLFARMLVRLTRDW